MDWVFVIALGCVFMMGLSLGIFIGINWRIK